jgi:hypothetical protein
MGKMNCHMSLSAAVSKKVVVGFAVEPNYEETMGKHFLILTFDVWAEDPQACSALWENC